jgi:hypothetical protein
MDSRVPNVHRQVLRTRLIKTLIKVLIDNRPDFGFEKMTGSARSNEVIIELQLFLLLRKLEWHGSWVNLKFWEASDVQ